MGKEHEPRPSSLSFEMVVKLAKETALEHGNHVPTLLVEGSRETALVQLQDIPDTPEGRIAQMFTLGLALGQEKSIGTLTQVFYIFEAWMSMGQGGKLPSGRPSQDPNRKEILMIANFKTRQQELKTVVLEMVRDSEGQLLDLREIKPNAGQAEFPLITAFVRGFQVGKSGKLN